MRSPSLPRPARKMNFRSMRIERCEPRCVFAAGALDTSLDADGLILHSFDRSTSNADAANAIVLQRDGKQLLVGSATSSSGGQDIAVLRLLPDGTPDTSFGTNGRAVVALNNGGDNNDRVAAVVMQPVDANPANDRIVLVGTTAFDGDTDLAVVRLLPNGQLDASFSGDGIAPIGGSGSDEAGAAVTIDGNGKLLVLGSTTMNGDSDLLVIRMEFDSAFDLTFGNSGFFVFGANIAGDRTDTPAGFAVRSDGKIAIGGTSRVGASDLDFITYRLTSAGQLDASYSGDGIGPTIPFNRGGSNQDKLSAIALDANDNIIAVGSVDTASNGWDFAATRLLSATGAPDPAFGVLGKTVISIDQGGNKNDFASAVAVDAGGKIVVAGSSQFNVPNNNDFAVVRLTTQGVLDSTFNGDTQTNRPGISIAYFDFPGGDFADSAAGIAIAPSSGAIFVAGVASTAIGSDFALAKMNGDPPAFPWHNARTRSNVDQMDGVDAGDILWTIHYYGLYSGGILPAPPDNAFYPLVDTFPDNRVDPQDILTAVTDYLNAQGGEGEANASAAAAENHPNDVALVAWLLGEELAAKRKSALSAA